MPAQHDWDGRSHRQSGEIAQPGITNRINQASGVAIPMATRITARKLNISRALKDSFKVSPL